MLHLLSENSRETGHEHAGFLGALSSIVQDGATMPIHEVVYDRNGRLHLRRMIASIHHIKSPSGAGCGMYGKFLEPRSNYHGEGPPDQTSQSDDACLRIFVEAGIIAGRALKS